METNNTYEYIPSAPIHPFEIVEDEIVARGMTKKEFATAIGMKPSNFSRMLKNKGELTSEMALKLETALGIPYRHWMRYQEQYLKDCARLIVSGTENTRDNKTSSLHQESTHEDWYLKLVTAIQPFKDRMESLTSLLSARNKDTSENLSKEQILTIENDIHSLGKALCELRLS